MMLFFCFVLNGDLLDFKVHLQICGLNLCKVKSCYETLYS